MEARNRSPWAGLDRWREPAAWVLIGTTALWLVVVAVGSRPSAEIGNGGGPLWLLGLAEFTQPGVLVALAAVALSCAVAGPTPRARLVVGLAAGLIGVAVAASVVAAVGLVAAYGGRSLDPPLYLLRAVPAAVAASALVVVFRHLGSAAPAEGTTAGGEPAALEPAASGDGPSTELEPRRTATDPGEPTWPLDQATGAVWSSAGEAAAGAPARRAAPDLQGWQPLSTAAGDDVEEGADPRSGWRPAGPPSDPDHGRSSSGP